MIDLDEAERIGKQGVLFVEPPATPSADYAYISGQAFFMAMVDELRRLRNVRSSGVKLAAFCARLSCDEDVPPGVLEEAITLANEFKNAAGIDQRII